MLGEFGIDIEHYFQERYCDLDLDFLLAGLADIASLLGPRPCLIGSSKHIVIKSLLDTPMYLLHKLDRLLLSRKAGGNLQQPPDNNTQQMHKIRIIHGKNGVIRSLLLRRMTRRDIGRKPGRRNLAQLHQLEDRVQLGKQTFIGFVQEQDVDNVEEGVVEADWGLRTLRVCRFLLVYDGFYVLEFLFCVRPEDQGFLKQV